MLHLPAPNMVLMQRVGDVCHCNVVMIEGINELMDVTVTDAQGQDGSDVAYQKITVHLQLSVNPVVRMC